ncbi:MAG TPA: NAD(P)H oxidoreductase [Verrucomicrobiales bacterium]|nr:NAD(P)H oxidoreductase [Verrucomicrobiales bacterium]
MARVLILFAHPALHRSRVNVALMAAVQGMEGVTFRDLYEEYPNLHIDFETEQELLLEHDIIVWQHPFYWYSAPAILKEWQDVVLEYGFAYGEGGTKLAGKKVMSALTTGGPEEAYHREGYNRYTMKELLAPFDQTARLCGMEFLDPFVIHGVRQLTDEQIQTWAQRYKHCILELRNL